MAGIGDFTGLITSEHAGQPNFVAAVAASVQVLVDQINALQSIPEFFDVDNAVGAQLDIVGLWVGLSRYVALSVNQYFSWDGLGIGWDQGIWWAIGDDTQTVTQLEDADYRRAIRAKILCNQWDGSLPAAINIIQTITGVHKEKIKVFEASMSVQFSIFGAVPRTIQAILNGRYLPLYPAGVEVGFYFLASAVLDSDFGGDVL